MEGVFDEMKAIFFAADGPFSTANKGSALIEMCISLPLMLALFCLLEVCEEGWTFRIRNRMMSRYVATASLRGESIPTPQSLKQRFNLSGTSVAIPAADTTELTFSPHLFNSTIKLKQSTHIWKPRGRSFAPSAQDDRPSAQDDRPCAQDDK